MSMGVAADCRVSDRNSSLTFNAIRNPICQRLSGTANFQHRHGSECFTQVGGCPEFTRSRPIRSAILISLHTQKCTTYNNLHSIIHLEIYEWQDGAGVQSMYYGDRSEIYPGCGGHLFIARNSFESLLTVHAMTLSIPLFWRERSIKSTGEVVDALPASAHGLLVFAHVSSRLD